MTTAVLILGGKFVRLENHALLLLSEYEQIILSFENSSSAAEEATSTTVPMAHDSSAEDMKEAILSLAESFFDDFVGELDVSREVNGAAGLEAYRYIDGDCTPGTNRPDVEDDSNIAFHLL